MRRSNRRNNSSPFSPSSSIESSSSNNNNNHQIPHLSFSPSFSNTFMKSSQADLPTDLRLGLTVSTTTTSASNSPPRQQSSAAWPRMKPVYRRGQATTNEEEEEGECSNGNLFVKVKMEGVRIGRKVDLLSHHGYSHLLTTLQHMFATPNILWSEGEQYSHQRCSHVLTYEDQEGDWMMVGDVPWEMFLTTVKRLRITRIET